MPNQEQSTSRKNRHGNIIKIWTDINKIKTNKKAVNKIYEETKKLNIREKIQLKCRTWNYMNYLAGEIQMSKKILKLQHP